MNLWDFLQRQQVKATDMVVGGVATVGLTAWGTYEVIARNFGYADAPLMTAVACCGTPLAVAAGGVWVRRRLRGGLRFVRWEELRRWVYGAETAESGTPSEQPNINGWVNVVRGLSRARRPVLPIGKTASGALAAIDFDTTHHHLIVNGETGSGKTMYVLRPLAAAAAMSGLFQVVILDKSGRNFRVLEGHPNIHVLRYNHESLPDIAKSLYEEVMRRDKWLAGQPDNPTTLDRARADRRPPRVLVIIDEFANAAGLLREIDKGAYGRMTASLIQVAQEGRAMGMHLCLVAQRPDATQVNTTLRSQLKSLTFQLRDVNDSRLADAPGAEGIGEGQFVLKGKKEYQTVWAFRPSDEELRQALAAESAKECGEPTWLHGYRRLQTVTNMPQNTPKNGSVTGYNGRDLGTNAFAFPGEGAVTAMVTPKTVTRGAEVVTTVVEREELLPLPHRDEVAERLLADKRPSLVQGMTVGQVQLAALCLLSGERITPTCYRVFGGKNDRYQERIKMVQAMLQSNMGFQVLSS